MLLAATGKGKSKKLKKFKKITYNLNLKRFNNKINPSPQEWVFSLSSNNTKAF